MEKIKPQPGFQTAFVTNRSDIVIAGSGAGPGKTFGLLLDPLRHIDKPGWGAVILRRTMPQIKYEGGLWDSSMKIYPSVGGVPKESTAEWKFPSGVKFKFAHLEYEKNILDWQGSEIPYIGFDELTHFTKKMFFYLLSRNRSTCGVKPRVRATCNPDPDSWVADFVSWWIGEDGFPLPERQGKERFLIIDGENYIWGDTKEEVKQKGGYLIDSVIEASGGTVDPDDLIKSVSFLVGNIYENKKLLSVNPAYLSNLLSQDEATRSALLEGNWKAKPNENDLIDYYALKDSFTASKSINNDKYISADIALEGSDKLVVGYFEGYRLCDIKMLDKSNGSQVVAAIEDFKRKYGVRNRHIIYDNDGVGGFLGGFIKGAIPFLNGGSPKKKENYKNLKTQCYYKFSEMVNSDLFEVDERVAKVMYNEKENVQSRIMKERKAIKRDKADYDGKLQIIPKQQMKVILGGSSPDILDMCMMRMYFDLVRTSKGVRYYN